MNTQQIRRIEPTAETIGICVACFNRREKTLSLLKQIYELKFSDDLKVLIYILDDASTDGTADAI